MIRILLVEDEINVGSTLWERLLENQYDAQWAKSLEEGKTAFETKTIDLVLLDITLPDGSGLELADWIRKRSPQTAIVFLTAMGDPESRVRGLELGAEDYIVKPFHLKELLLRIQNCLKRVSRLNLSETQAVVSIGAAQVDFERFEISRNGKLFPLTHKECSLLKLLYEKEGKVVSRDEILDLVWSADEYPTPRTVDNFVVRLRKSLGNDENQTGFIKNVRGIGYQLYVKTSTH